jgi:hypothetical protein
MPPAPDPSVPVSVRGALMASGFPFQTAVANLISQTPGWSVAHEEFPWQDPGGTDHFDIVAMNGTVLALLECKKTQRETFTFLRPSLGTGEAQDVRRFRCFFVSQIDDSTRRGEVFCSDWDVSPTSVESMFCVVSTSDRGRDQRLLERDAQTLVRATEAYAYAHRASFTPTAERAPDRLCLPIIVTNAQLFVARYDPAAVSLDTGQFREPPQDVRSVRWARFRKPFTSEGGIDLGDRTVLVVSAASLADLLLGLGSQSESLRGDRGRSIPPRPRR